MLRFTLKSLQKDYLNLLFKGGTSLSKCYKAINRFSEDIDLTLEQEVITQGQRKKVKQIIKDTCDALNLKLLNESETRSRRDFNRYEIDYAPELEAIAIKPILLVEITYIVKAYPSEVKEATSLIYDYMTSIGQEDFTKEYELRPFMISVQRVDRTLIDKVFALCDYYLTNKVKERSRHIYDVNKLLEYVELNDALVELFKSVREDRKRGNSQCVSANDEYNITILLQEIIEKEVYKADYQDITEHVLYEKMPYEKAIEGLQQLIDSKLFG